MVIESAAGDGLGGGSGFVCVFSSYGPDAHEALAAAVGEARDGDPLAPVTVVVPSNYVGIAARRGLARRRGGVAAVSFVTAYTLAENLGGTRLAARNLKPVSTPVIAGVVRSVLRDAPGYFAGVETHPATERSLVRAHRELSEAGSDALDVLGQQSERAADVVRIHRRVLKVLQGKGFSNEQDLLEAAIAEVGTWDAAGGAGHGARATGALGPVIVFLPQHLTPHQAKLLKVVAAASARPIPLIVGITGAQDADAKVLATLERLGVDVSPGMTACKHGPALSQPETTSRLEAPTAPASLAGQGPWVDLAALDVRALSVSDAEDEVRHAVRAVVAAIRRGIPLERCGILYGARVPYARLITEALDAAGIREPVGGATPAESTRLAAGGTGSDDAVDHPTLGIRRCGTSMQSAASCWLGRSLLGLLALRDDGFTRRGVMSWLETAQPSLNAKTTGSSNRRQRHWTVPVAAWERVAREARVGRGITDWESRLETFSRERRAEGAKTGGDEDRQWLREKYLREADHADELASFVQRLHDALDSREAPAARSTSRNKRRTWRQLSMWCRGLIREYLSGTDRESWPAQERRLADKVEEVVERLGDLDLVDSSPTVAQFRQTLEMELSAMSVRHGRFGHGVFVGPLGEGLGLEFDLVVICGMAEGTLPGRSRDDALLADRERRSVNGHLELRGDRTGDEHRHLLAVLAGAERSLLLYPRGDLRRSVERMPSRWLLDVAEAREGRRATSGDLASTTGEWFTEVPSFVAGMTECDFPGGEQEFDSVVMLQAHGNQANAATPGRVLKAAGRFGRPEVARAVELVLDRKSKDFTRFDGNLAGLAVEGVSWPHPADGETITSASRLEAWARCPHAYFVRYVLGVAALDDDRDSHAMSPLDYGNLVHQALQQWLDEVLANPEPQPPELAWSQHWRNRLRDIGAGLCRQYERRGLSGRRLYQRRDRDRILRDLDRFIDFDNEKRRVHQSTPAAAELGFGMTNSIHGPAPVRLPGGLDIRIRGSIDRLDTTAGGHLVVIDYKTGKIKRYKDLKPETPSPEGKHLQLVLYGEAARWVLGRCEAVPGGHGLGSPRTAEATVESSREADPDVGTATDYGAYWFVSLQDEKNQSPGYNLDHAVRGQVLATVEEIVTGIRAGVFPKRPPRPGDRNTPQCPFCTPDGLSSRPAFANWLRNSRADELGAYVKLTTPPPKPKKSPAKSKSGQTTSRRR